MRDVIHSDRGTGKRARISAAEMAGKTGTAQANRGDEEIDHGWMILFAPYEKPRYAVAVIIEDVESAGVTTAPRVKKLMQRIFELEEKQASVQAKDDLLARASE